MVLVFFVLPFVVYFVLQSGKHHFRTLPYYGEKSVAPNGDTIYHIIPEFQMLDYTGNTITRDTLLGKIIVADVFFSRCAGPCPKLSGNMSYIQNQSWIKDDPEIRLFSMTVDPTFDSIPVLKSYAGAYKAIPHKWYMVTGDQKSIFELANKGFLFRAWVDANDSINFVHDEHLALVDKEGHIRGFYDGTNGQEVKKLMDEINVLKYEYQQRKGE